MSLGYEGQCGIRGSVNNHPAKIFNAVQFSVNTELWRKHGITLSEDWFPRFNNAEEVPYVADVADR
ncbi:uncharacterized protein LOC124459830 isoform X2 [Drosophila willistoni]|nr:uncharacterized protein LOC124459830 isoform X2 [Drosophila willistoni]